MGNEETLSGFPIKQAVPALVSTVNERFVIPYNKLPLLPQIRLLKMEHNFDMVCLVFSSYCLLLLTVLLFR